MQSIAHIVLNFSFFSVFFLYIPQLIHNFRYRRVRELSLHYHALLLLAAMADLYYGFGRISQWQYRCSEESIFDHEYILYGAEADVDMKRRFMTSYKSVLFRHFAFAPDLLVFIYHGVFSGCQFKAFCEKYCSHYFSRERIR